MAASIVIATRTAGAHPAPQDGDIGDACNMNRIQWLHAHLLTLPQNDPLTVGGFRSDGLGRQWLEAVSQYRYERVNATQFRRVTLADASEVILGPEVGDVAEFVRRRRANPNHRIYGSDGAEVWYGGETTKNATTLDDVWARIEGRTANSRTDARFQSWPWSAEERRLNFIVEVNDFTDATMAQYTTPQVTNGTTTMFRTHFFGYWNVAVPGWTTDQIRDRDVEVSLGVVLNSSLIVQAK